jgi:hypothetical protein
MEPTQQDKNLNETNNTETFKRDLLMFACIKASISASPTAFVVAGTEFP